MDHTSEQRPLIDINAFRLRLAQRGDASPLVSQNGIELRDNRAHEKTYANHKLGQGVRKLRKISGVLEKREG